MLVVDVIIFCGSFALCCIFFEMCYIAYIKPYIKLKKKSKEQVDILIDELAKNIARIIKKYKG